MLVVGGAMLAATACAKADAAQMANAEAIVDRLHDWNGLPVVLESWSSTKPYLGDGKIVLVAKDFVEFKKGDDTVAVPLASILLLRQKGNSSHTIVIR